MGKYPQKLIEHVFYWNESWNEFDANPRTTEKPRSPDELIKNLETLFDVTGLTDNDIREIIETFPKEERTNTVDFGGAIKALKAGKKVSRLGWNGAGMYLIVMPGYPDGIPCNENTAKAHNIEIGTKLFFRPYFQLKTAQNDIAMWSPSGSDALAEDWVVLD